MSNKSFSPDSLSTPESNLELIERIVDQYPEMSWLTGDVNATPESSVESNGQKTVGAELFPNLSPDQIKEFDRTATGLICLNMVKNGDFEGFTQCQKGDTKLTRDQFDHLMQYTDRILTSEEDYEAMEAFTVLNDLGKVKSVVDKIALDHDIVDVDHDVLLLRALELDPSISPSFSGLSAKYQQLILNGLKTKFNIGHLTQAESLPPILDGLREIDQRSLDFYLVHALYDTAGVVGHAVQNGSLVMNSPLYDTFSFANETI